MRGEGATERQSCRLLELSRSVHRYNAKADGSVIREEIKKIKRKYPKYGSPRITNLLRRQGYNVNHKRVERICREEGWLVKKRRKARRKSSHTGIASLPLVTQPNQLWAMDFVKDQTMSGQFRTLTIVDVVSRRSPATLVSHSMKNGVVISLLETLKKKGDLPEVIMVDNGPEFTSNQFISWCQESEILIYYIDKGCPTQNAYIESFNSRFRDECLSCHMFKDIDHARRVINQWRNHYNAERPHSSLDYKTPMEYESELLMHSQPEWS